MKVRTDTECKYCTHNKVCSKINKPTCFVESLVNFNSEDDGIDVVVSCIDFDKIAPRPKRIDCDFGFDSISIKEIDDEMYEICKDCPYCYREVNQCMYGEEGIPDNLEKKCNKEK